MLNTLSEIRYPCSGNLSSLSTIYGCHSGKVSQFYLKGKGTKCLVRRMTGLMTNSSQKWRVDLSPRQGTYSMAAFFLRLPSLVANFLKWRPVATQEKSCRRIIRKWSAWQLCLAYHNPRLIYGWSQRISWIGFTAGIYKDFVISPETESSPRWETGICPISWFLALAAHLSLCSEY